MFDYLTKISITNLKEFIVESINHLGWESDLFTRPQGFFKSCLEVSINLGWGHLHHLMFITELLLVSPVAHMDPLLTPSSSLLCVTR